MFCVCGPRHLCAGSGGTPYLKLDTVMDFPGNCECYGFGLLEHVNVISVFVHFVYVWLCHCPSH